MQTFRELRERDCYYVDKTAYIERLLHEGKHYFLSRPRRFGKSLFLDTLKELFEGSEELFAGLRVHAGHDWSERCPVVRLSFGGGNFRELDLLEANVMEQLAAAERRLWVVSEYLTAVGRFAYLLEALFEFKVAEMAPSGSALVQLQERGYADKYRARGEPVHLIGVEFSRDTRNVTTFEVADG